MHIPELCRLLDLADRLLNDLHVLVIPFGLLGPLYDSALLLHKGFDLFKDYLISFLVTIPENLHGDLDIALFDFTVSRL